VPSGSVPELSSDAPSPATGVHSPDQHSRTIYVAVAIAIALWQGMIGVLVKWSTWPPVTMVWARCVVTVVALWLFARWRPAPVAATATPAIESVTDWSSTRRATWGSGALLAGHWVTLFLGYRFCSVGPVVVALCTFPVMAAVAEPWFFPRRAQRLQLFTACVATSGVAAMRLWDGGSVGSEAPAAAENTLLGITLGLCSAAFFTARSIIARKLLRHTSAVRIMYEQAIVVAVLLLPSALLFEASHWSVQDVLLVLVLGVGFTAIPHTLGVWSMKKLTVATSGVVSSLQTVSALVLAQLLLAESISIGTWLGAGAVMLAVAIESLTHARERTS
jgi:drug/metabolite transporter (DMT)-like permease